MHATWPAYLTLLDLMIWQHHLKNKNYKAPYYNIFSTPFTSFLSGANTILSSNISSTPLTNKGKELEILNYRATIEMDRLFACKYFICFTAERKISEPYLNNLIYKLASK
jgi:hypothetical protein